MRLTRKLVSGVSTFTTSRSLLSRITNWLMSAVRPYLTPLMVSEQHVTLSEMSE